jgi:hypothetical protein
MVDAEAGAAVVSGETLENRPPAKAPKEEKK